MRFLLSLPLLAALPARALATPCPDVMLVQDRSGSMVAFRIGGKTKWQVNLDALNAVLPKFNSSLSMGLAVFPDEKAGGFELKSACTPGGVRLDPALGNVPRILETLKKAPQPLGGTPTWETLARLQDYGPFKDPSRPHYVLLITDGQPNCTEKDCCPDLGMCDACKLWKCTGAASTIEQIAMLAAKGIKTIVVGFAGVGEGGSCGVMVPYDPESLDRMAEAGGIPRAVPPSPRKFYDVFDAASFEMALTEIAGKIAGGTVGGCVGGGGSDAGAGGGSDAGSGGGPGGAGGAPGGSDAGGDGQGGGPHGGSHDPPGCACHAGDAPAGPDMAILVVGIGTVLARRARRPSR